MSIGASERAGSGTEAARRLLSPGDAAWIAAVPGLLLTAAAMLVLGPLLGRIMARGAPHDYWPSIAASGAVQPEPTEQARYVLSLAAPLLVSGACLLAAWRPRLRPRAIGPLEQVMQLLAGTLALGFVIVVPRLSDRFGSIFPRRVYFTERSIALALAFAVLAFVVLRAPRLRARVAAVVRPARDRPALALALAVLATAAYALTAVNTDSSIALAHEGVFNEMTGWFDDAFAALLGQGPLAGIHAQYSQLWPYLAAGAMALFGTTTGVYTAILATCTGLAMLALYAILRRIVRNAIAALLLFIPLLAMGFFIVHGPFENRLAPSNLLSDYPERFGGPYLLAWLVARHIDGVRPRHPWVLFLAGGLVLLNNFEFGFCGVVATVGALVWSQRIASLDAVRRLLGAALAGFALATAAVALLTLVTAGTLPHFSWLFTYVRIYGSGGFAMWPLPRLGIHFALYMTYAATIVVASVRVARRDPGVVLTGMLVWSGIFGFGTGGYYVGQTAPESLIYIFSPWAFAIVLLFVVVVQAAHERMSRLPTLAELAVLFGFGLALCSVVQIPLPWAQIARIERGAAPPYTHNSLERFIAEDTRRGEPVMLLTRLPHRTAYDIGVVDVVPYPTGLPIMPLVSQFTESLDRLRKAHGHKVFLWTTDMWPGMADTLSSAGFVLKRSFDDDTILKHGGTYQEWRDG